MDDKSPGKDSAFSKGGEASSKSETLYREFLSRRESGEMVEPEEYLELFPELELELRELFHRLKEHAAAKGEGSPGERKVTPADGEGTPAGGERGPKDPATPPSEAGGDRMPDGRPRILGDFRILREIGSGGMGTVYEADQISLKRRVALKLLPSHLSFSDRAVKKFQREAEAGGRQHHPNLVTIYAVGEHDGIHYIAQELVEGGRTLADQLDRFRSEIQPMGFFRDVAALVADIADGLQHAHDTKVIHRDIKPSNILLTDEGEPKVTDFGLARVEDALELSRTGEFAGTPYYMSPEQVMVRRIGIDHRTDIYSLGVTLYEILTLKRPFEGKTSQEILKKIIFKEAVDPHKVNPRVPMDLAVICLKAMEKEPDRRFQTMTELSDDLHRFLQGEVIHAKRSGPATKAWKRVKRNPVVSGAVAIALLSILALVVGLPWIIAHKEREKRVAVEEAARKAEEIKNFLGEMLASCDPGAHGIEVKVREMLDETARSIDGKFVDQPEVNAEIRMVMGKTYGELGVFDAAEAQFEKALEIRRAILGAEHRDTLSTMSRLALNRRRRGRTLDGEALARKTLEIQERVLGPDDPGTLFTRNRLGLLLYDLYRLDEAEALMTAVLRVRQRDAGIENKETLSTMNDLANLKGSLGHYGEARTLHEEILEIRRRVLGDTDRDTLVSMKNLARAYRNEREFDRCEALYLETLETQRRVLGAEHGNTISTVSALSVHYCRQGRLEEAETLCREALEHIRSTAKENSPAVPGYMACLAGVLRRCRKLPESEALYREAIKEYRNALGDRNLKTLNTLVILAVLLKARGYPQKAEPLCREAVEGLREVNGETHRSTLSAMGNLGWILQDLNRMDEGEPYLREVLKIRSSAQGEEHPDTLGAMNDLALMFHNQRRHEEAEALYRKVEAGQRRVLGEEHHDYLVTLNNLAYTLGALKKLDEAAENYRTILRIEAKTLQEDDPNRLITKSRLAWVLKKLGRLDESERLFREVMPVQRTTMEPDDPEFLLSLTQYAMVLTDLERFDEAATLYLEGIEIATAALPEDDVTRAMLHRGYGRCLTGQKQYENAESRLLEGYNALGDALGEDNPLTVEACRLLAELYEAWGKPEEAENYRSRLPPDEEGLSERKGASEGESAAEEEG